MSIEFEGPEAHQTPVPADSGGLPSEAPTTGDGAIDAVLADVASVQDAPLAERIDAGERALTALQSRLNDLGGA